MYVKRNYGFWMTLNWSKKPLLVGLLYSAIICVIYILIDGYILVPWQPISIIGIAVAFYLGFKNNSSYDRTWEARKIWGSIVNNSRSFAAASISFIQGDNQESIKKEMIYRHIAWITALRHQLRLSRPWEHLDKRLEKLYSAKVCEDYNEKLDSELSKFISENELAEVQGKSNTATQIMKRQAIRLQELKDLGYFDDFRHMEFHQLIVSFYEDQGKSERIKNFPFPRQYASTTLWLTFVFCAFVPFGLLDIFRNTDDWRFWICPIISALIIWVFFLMEKIGDYSENPFEGSYNDVPITSIARGIEIDLREMLNDDEIPPAMEAQNGFLL
ncbi:multidrug transporter [Gramella lutea]|uniref:Multidrug transporter n=1 Tax=Christiangramia lutea TaxID=1607951 RepID=A0A9X1V5B9_9FLAO|nr:bestrophin family ion channel [Christiangramia lutea]MCH4824386.1 multidrug transporter [Christiangramia lutea]